MPDTNGKCNCAQVFLANNKTLISHRNFIWHMHTYVKMFKLLALFRLGSAAANVRCVRVCEQKSHTCSQRMKIVSNANIKFDIILILKYSPYDKRRRVFCRRVFCRRSAIQFLRVIHFGRQQRGKKQWEFIYVAHSHAIKCDDQIRLSS